MAINVAHITDLESLKSFLIFVFFFLCLAFFFLGSSGLDLGPELPDTLDELELGHGHGDVQDGAGDPALVLAVHQPDELRLAGIRGMGTHHLRSRSVPGPGEKQTGSITPGVCKDSFLIFLCVIQESY